MNDTPSRVLAERLVAEPGQPMNWHLLGVAYATEGLTADLLALCDQAAPHFGSAVKFFSNVAIDLSQSRRWDVLARLADTIPSARPEHALALYYTGCEQVALGNHEAALDAFAAFKAEIEPNHAAYPLANDANINTVFRQGTLVESLSATDALLARPSGIRPPDPIWHTKPDADVIEEVGHVVLACMDARYFQRFADRLIAGIEKDAPLHLHVIDPGPDVAERFADMCAEHPHRPLSLSTEPAGAWNNPVYYTCARFFMAQALLETSRCSVVCLDADSYPTLTTGKILAAAKGADMALFKTDRTEPASVYQAGIMVFPDRDRTKDLLARLQAFVLAKLDRPPVLAWMLDQAALYSVLTWTLKQDPDFIFVDLAEALGTGLGEALHQLGSDTEKKDIMNAS